MPLPRNNDPASTFRSLDWPTIIIYLFMVVAGMVSIYAACYDFDYASIFSIDEFSGKQMRWIVLAVVLGGVLLLADARLYDTYAFPIFLIMLIVLAITPVIAPDIKGSHSWIKIGSFSLQPAEFAKFATALALAKLFSTYQFSLKGIANYAKALAIICIPVLLILLQNETGSALVFLSLFLVLYREGMSGLVLFAAVFSVVIFVVTLKYSETMIMGMSSGIFTVLLLVQLIMVGMAIIYDKRPEVGRNLLLAFVGVGVAEAVLSLCGIPVPGLIVNIVAIVFACIYLAIMAIRNRRPKFYIPCATALLALGFMLFVGPAFKALQPHQQLRIQVALGIVEDLRNAGYNVNQSKIAIGSGGFAGKGFLNGTQTKLKYVPEQHTDFIFCTIGEEEGFLGAAFVTMLFVALILRIITIAERQPTTFGRVYAYSVASYFIFHFCINIGMVIGICPVIGIPLPFFSYGGSSLWGFTILLFILLKIDANRKNILAH